jgi:integrase
MGQTDLRARTSGPKSQRTTAFTGNDFPRAALTEIETSKAPRRGQKRPAGQRIAATSRRSRGYPALAFAAYPGGRRGKVLALRGSDVNFEQRQSRTPRADRVRALKAIPTAVGPSHARGVPRDRTSRMIATIEEVGGEIPLNPNPSPTCYTDQPNEAGERH